jgi:hypothetical protein
VQWQKSTAATTGKAQRNRGMEGKAMLVACINGDTIAAVIICGMFMLAMVMMYRA